MKQYRCTWYEPQYAYEVRTVSPVFFSADRGYDEHDQAAIDALGVGEKAQFDCHDVVRIADHVEPQSFRVRCPDHRNGGATYCPRGGPALQIWQRKQWGDA